MAGYSADTATEHQECDSLTRTVITCNSWYWLTEGGVTRKVCLNQTCPFIESPEIRCGMLYDSPEEKDNV